MTSLADAGVSRWPVTGMSLVPGVKCDQLSGGKRCQVGQVSGESRDMSHVRRHVMSHVTHVCLFLFCLFCLFGQELND